MFLNMLNIPFLPNSFLNLNLSHIVLQCNTFVNLIYYEESIANAD